MEDINIEELVKDRKKFNEFVYTPLDEAVEELKRRWEDSSIKMLNFVPEAIADGFKAVLYVSVITPNNQIRRYVEMASNAKLEPLVFEQCKDKFTSNNEWKHSLGKLHFCIGTNKNNYPIIEFLNIIDFNKYNGKNIPSVDTFWNQPLIEFHHEIFFKTFLSLSEKNIFDASNWFKKMGSEPREYYHAFLSLLIKNGIQFENYMLNEAEFHFTKEVFLPAFIDVYKKNGLKPLIVALEPIETEGDRFWISYSREEKEFVVNKLNSIKR